MFENMQFVINAMTCCCEQQRTTFFEQDVVAPFKGTSALLLKS
jgi:hypothetical protein